MSGDVLDVSIALVTKAEDRGLRRRDDDFDIGSESLGQTSGNSSAVIRPVGDLEHLVGMDAFAAWLAPFHKSEWVVYAKPPFGGPEAVLTYLSRYTHRVAISNHRLVSADANTVTFRWKDYRVKNGNRQKVMHLATPEFIRRFLIHVLPDGFHRIRHYGLLASGLREPCPCCGSPMRIIEIFRRVQKPMSRAPPREQAA